MMVDALEEKLKAQDSKIKAQDAKIFALQFMLDLERDISRALSTVLERNTNHIIEQRKKKT